MVFHELPLCTREHRDGAPHPKVLAGVQGTMAELAVAHARPDLILGTSSR